jgi:hypothetical protein
MDSTTPDAPAARVSFGPKDYQTLELEVASMLLTLWRDRQAATFGSYLAEVLTGTRPAASRERKPKP